MRSPPTTVTVDGRTLRVSSLDKPMYPGDGTTKADVISYYLAVAPVLLPQLADRPVTRVRWPNGTGAPSFFEKNLPKGAPSWVPRVVLPVPGSTTGRETMAFPLVEDRATLVWLAQLAALELHVPQWRVDDRGRPAPPDRLVIDLDPGPGVGLDQCAHVALLVRDLLTQVGLSDSVPVTSGSKGVHVYAALPGTQDADAVRRLAHDLAHTLTLSHPDLVVSAMTKALRPGKVLLDWSQNTAAKTTICPYSLRGTADRPFVAAPRSWSELSGASAPPGDRGASLAGGPLRQLTASEVLERLQTGPDTT